MIRSKSLFCCAISLLAALMVLCGRESQIAGNGTQTGNPVALGKILTADGKPAAGALVRIVPVDYVPSFSLAKKTPVPICTTDAGGQYSIFAIDSGAYNIEAVLDTQGVFKNSVGILPDSFNQYLGEAYLHRLGCISGISFMSGQNDTNQVRVSIYMPGTRRITKPLIGGQFSFDNVPAGRYQIIFDPTLNTYNVKVLDVDLAAGECKNLDTVALIKYEPDIIEIAQASVAGTWGPGKVYKVLSRVMIPRGQTLTILPGTTIKLYEDFLNYGKLLIQGNKDSLITIEYGYTTGRSMYELVNSPLSGLNDTSLVLRWAVIKNMFTGLRLDGGGDYISNCAFVNCERALFWWGAGESVTNSSLTISNCVFWKNSLALDNYYNNTDSASIINSIFIDNDTCISIYNVGGNTFNHCLFYGNRVTLKDTLITNSVFADPLFVSLDSLHPDFHLQPGSPCIKAGIDSTDIGLYSTYEP